MNYFYCFCFCILFFSCDQTEENVSTYFGGEIINPNTKYVILYKDNTPRDTIYLDSNNRFIYKTNTLKEGLYSFKHFPEKQIVLLEQGDSIFFRLNTLEFDESLVFTGRGAKKNNFLINTFLKNEKDRKKLKKHGYKLSPLDFQKKQNQYIQKNIVQHQQISKKYKFTPLAHKITKASFTYDFYARHEIYFRKHCLTSNRDNTTDIPKNFFTYRNQVNFNDTLFKRLYAYNRYLKHYITNISYTNHPKENSYSKNTTRNTLSQLNIIDSLITNTFIKNNLLRTTTRQFLLNSDDHNASSIIFEHYKNYNSNITYLKELKMLYHATEIVKPNHQVPEQELLTIGQKTVFLSRILKKPITVLYFWDTKHMTHALFVHRKAYTLKMLYPNIDFIAINRDHEIDINVWAQLEV